MYVSQEIYQRHKLLDRQGGEQGAHPGQVEQAKVLFLAVESGEVKLPFSQGVAEAYLVAQDLQDALTLLKMYPDFLVVATDYAMLTHPDLFYRGSIGEVGGWDDPMDNPNFRASYEKDNWVDPAL